MKRTKDNKWEIGRPEWRTVATYEIHNLITEDGDLYHGAHEYRAEVLTEGWRFEVRYYRAGYVGGEDTYRLARTLWLDEKPDEAKVLWGFRRWVVGKKGA